MKTLNTVATDVIARLEAGSKLSSLYARLELLEPLLNSKLGGPMGLPRCWFARIGKERKLSTRFPDEFAEGFEASWETVSPDESREMRDHLLDVLKRWVAVESERRPDPPRELNFDETLDKVAAEHRDMKDEQSQYVHFRWRRWQCFLAAYDLVFGDNEAQAKRVMATLRLVPSFDEDSELWESWPKSNGFVTFASYQGFATSALGMAEVFTRSVHGAMEIAKVHAFDRFVTTGISEVDFRTWWLASRDEARNVTLAVQQWSMSEVLRGQNMLYVGALNELTTVQTAVDMTVIDELSSWHRKLLLAMFDLHAYDGLYQTREAIKKKADYPSEGRKAFRPLVGAGLVVAAKNKKGMLLTEKGLAIARKLRELEKQGPQRVPKSC